MNAPAAEKTRRRKAGDERASAWSRYWAAGVLHSCPTSFDGNYDDAIAAFWCRSLWDLAPESRLLDIGSGNGALPKLLLDTLGDEKLPLIEAIDLSAVVPPWLNGCSPEAAARIRFSSGVAAEHLPFEDCSFTHIVSQYGFEYAAREQALAELLRMVRADACIALVLHHTQSRPVAVAAEELAHTQWLLSDGGLLDVAQLLGPYLERARSEGPQSLHGDASAQALRARYNVLQRAASERAVRSSVPDLLNTFSPAVAQVLASVAAGGWAAAQDRLGRMRQALADNRLRLQELGTHALGAGEVRTLAAALEQAGFRCLVDRLVTSGHLMGWTLVARRGATSAGRTGA